MRRSEADEHIHQVLVALQMLEARPGDDSTERVTNEVYPFVVVESFNQVQSDLLGYCLAECFQGIVNFVLDSLDEEPMAVGVVNIHEVSGLFKVYATSLIAVDHHDQRVDLNPLSGLRFFWCKILDDKERMM